ncbi:protein of unknown function UPF0270 [Syntrophotalea carbinolica DSM 2380]|uniref:YheU family protein n=1 Tax=Syntrophotalea carbinolica (strain DSM 2380 / NBRC 103641 / GraBd1) TaxID=338963 RepID=Q3A0L0_SYNC1|nr:YheU family protein [Syntrophotalea carbinolica]ABA90097.1 protein of unknown function UPF0270 [Syntrophotalea carbinolica DSM 2380]
MTSTPKINADHGEQGIDIPYEQLNPDTLRRMIEEFVTRDGSNWAEAGCTLEDKVKQVLAQLKARKVKVVFDLTSQTANLVPCP